MRDLSDEQLEADIARHQHRITKLRAELRRRQRKPIPFPRRLPLAKVLKWRVWDLELGNRAVNCLRADNIEAVGDLVQFTEAYLLRLPNFGRHSLYEVKTALLGYKLRLGMQPEELQGWPAVVG